MAIHIRAARPRRGIAIAISFALGAVLVMLGGAANAATVATVPMGTSDNYSVLGSTTVTNTGNSTLAESLGLWPGTSITGFPPGLVLAPGTTDQTNGAAQQAQSDLTVAYLNAEGRSVDAITTADLGNLILGAGVYAGPSKSPLSLTGPLVLDGAGDPSSVFIFQTDSTLITDSASTVTLVNGAQACNVFWQVGSSATLGSSSVFAGNILALTSITANAGATVHGRALARNGAVTLQNNTFTTSTCALGGPTTTTSAGGATATTTPGGGGTPTATTPGGGGTPTATTPGGGGTPTPTTPGGGDTPPGLPRTGTTSDLLAVIGFAACLGGLAIAGVTRRRRVF